MYQVSPPPHREGRVLHEVQLLGVPGPGLAEQLGAAVPGRVVAEVGGDHLQREGGLGLGTAPRPPSCDAPKHCVLSSVEARLELKTIHRFSQSLKGPSP